MGNPETTGHDPQHAEHGFDRALEHDLDAVKRAVRSRFGSRVSTITLGGSFARGEGCYLERDGETVPAHNLNFFLITSVPVPDEELEEAEREIRATTHVESVVLRSYVEAELAKLPPSPETVDLKSGSRTVDGDPFTLDKIPSYERERLPIHEAEKVLRHRLMTLLEGAPADPDGSDDRPASRAWYLTAKAVFAAMDAFLIRQGLYRSTYHAKHAEFVSRVRDPHLIRLADRALAIKVTGRVECGDNDDRAEHAHFWFSTARLYLDCLLELFQPAGGSRPERLRSLISSFHFQTTSARRTARGLSRVFLHRNRRGRLERLLLSLVVARDPTATAVVDLDRAARRAGLPRGLSWSALAQRALELWCSLPVRS